MQVLSRIQAPPRLVLKRDYRNIRLILSLAGELYSTVDESIEGVVLAHSDVLVRIVDCTPPTDNDIAGFNYFAASVLETMPFALRLTTVL